MKVLIGTNNAHKYKVYKYAFGLYAPEIELLNPSDLNIKDEPEEDADTLVENAIKKAKFFGEKAKIITIADDTGVFVDALGGEPGLHAKRWQEGNDHDRCVKLLERLKDVPKEARTVHYGWGVAAYNPLTNKLWTFEYKLEGFISDDFRDVGGFGYDKMFNLPSLGKHYSELSISELNEISGRGRGVKELILNTNFLK
ncbi:MAG: non-canonical purine NTP pyrophosphatase [Candidatus Staskawiczbacteria bacterium]|nr:non-canonical purine NTP pyrophosphatase [Candidatus Staskawiczbacteria bacterium]